MSGGPPPRVESPAGVLTRVARGLRDGLRWLFVQPIRFYRRRISPYTPPSCRFQPTCSAYGERAILQHGLLKGGLLTAWRILRCQPFSAGGPDPVPAPGRWRASAPVPPPPVPGAPSPPPEGRPGP